MVVHSEMAKKIGMYVAIFGIIVIVVAGSLIIPTQDISVGSIPFMDSITPAIALSYAVTIGVYFVMTGIFVWLIGAGIEWRALKRAELEAKENGQAEDGVGP